jgi:hypothetical protein
MEAIILNSWREIAQYVGRGVRTVERWERKLGLPVHRPQGHLRSPVIAISTEIDEWLGNGRLKKEQATGQVTSQLELKRIIVELRANTELLQRNRELMLQGLGELQKAITRVRELLKKFSKCTGQRR